MTTARELDPIKLDPRSELLRGTTGGRLAFSDLALGDLFIIAATGEVTETQVCLKTASSWSDPQGPIATNFQSVGTNQRGCLAPHVQVIRLLTS
jgi:hypothetical protein